MRDTYQPSEKQAVQAIYAFAAEQMRNGNSNSQIQSMLVREGLDHEAASMVVGNLREMRSKAVAAAGKMDMIFGALWCIGGIVLTAATYIAAGSAGGGKYIVVWGAIVFGAIQFFQGLGQLEGE